MGHLLLASQYVGWGVAPASVGLAARLGGRVFGKGQPMLEAQQAERKPGVCIPWEEKIKELPPIQGDADLARKVWQDVDALGYVFIWQCMLSF